MRKKYRRFRVTYTGQCEVSAENQELAIDKMNRILDRIGDVYEVHGSENEIREIESEEM